MPGLIHVVDDDVSFRSAVERQLKHTGYEVALYASAEDFLERLPQDGVPSCVLIDMRLSGLTGLEVQSRLRELGSTLPLIFISGHIDIPTTVRALKAGAHDFLTKPVVSGDLLPAIERALALHRTSREQQTKRDIIRSLLASLTPREGEVFLQVVGGKKNKQIAAVLGCTERTVKAHRQQVMEKMQVQTLTDLVLLAEQIGVDRLAAGSAT